MKRLMFLATCFVITLAVSGLCSAESPCFVVDGKLVDFSFCQKFASQGVAEAQLIIGQACDEGLGVPKDYIQAMSWYKKAANQDMAFAMNRLGEMYEEGLGVTSNPKEAVGWYLKGAEAGVSESQDHLGRMYLQGRGVAQDKVEAFKWFLISSTSPRVSKTAAVELEKIGQDLKPPQITMACQRAKKGIEELRDPMQKLFFSERLKDSKSPIGKWCR